MNMSAPFTPIVVQMAAGLLCGGLINWLADILPYWRQDKVRPRMGRVRWWMVMAASVGIFLYVGRQSGLLIEEIRFDSGLLLYVYLPLFLLIATIDLEHRRVLNIVLAPTALAALILAAFQSPLALGGAALSGLGGAILFFAVNLIRRGAIGAGDVKLAAVIGMIAGFPQVLVALVIGIIAGGVGASILMANGRVSRKGMLAYAPYLSLGAAVALLHGSQILAWYGQRLAW
ncbi:MAG: prepilin peptidase [Caldilineaceae bacterium]|nr:prepilin peptidase [Caldilineaceae bacterium]